MRSWFSRERRLAVWYHPSFRLPFAAVSLDRAFDSRRAQSVLTWLLDQRLVREDDVFEAPEAGYSDLRRVHDDEWLGSLDDPEVVAGVLGSHGPVPVDSVLELWRRGVGAAIEASRWVARNEGVAATLMGGFHHAAPARGGGFCGLNDIAVAIAARRAEGLEGRVLVIDFDAHPPDGLAAFMLEDVEIRSVSADSNWIAGGIDEVRVPLGASDDVYLRAVDKALEFESDPVLAFYLAGSDPARGDHFGGLDVTPEGLRERDRRVFEALGDVPTVVVPGGGYQKRAWAYFAGSLAAGAHSKKTVAGDYDPVARKVGRVARGLAPFEDDLEITEADLGGFGGPSREDRFLSHYTRHGLELVMERYGMTDALRRMGFSDLEIELQVSHFPHRMRVFGQYAGKRVRLMETSMAIRSVDRWQTLFIEWLELTDPRVPIDPERALPGQESPGLGLAREIGSMIEVAARRLHLAGVSFVPSHYHIAWMGRKQARIANPVIRGRFRAMRQYLDGVPLPVATAAVSRGLPTEDGEPVKWEPSIMVRALDPELLEWLRDGEPEAKRVERSTLDRFLPVHVAIPQG